MNELFDALRLQPFGTLTAKPRLSRCTWVSMAGTGAALVGGAGVGAPDGSVSPPSELSPTIATTRTTRATAAAAACVRADVPRNACHHFRSVGRAVAARAAPVWATAVTAVRA